MKERTPKKYATYFKCVQGIFRGDKTSLYQKAMIEEIFAICGEMPIKTTQISQVQSKKAVARCVQQSQNPIMTNFNIFLGSLKEGEEANFSFDNYQPLEVDISLCASLLFDDALMNSDQLPSYIKFIDEMSKKKHFLTFRKCLITLCKLHFEQQYLEKNISIHFIKLIGELYKIDAISSLTLKGFLECLIRSDQTRENFRQLVATTKDKILKLRGRNVSEATRILIDMVEKHQASVTGTIPKLAASAEPSGGVDEILAQLLTMPVEDFIKTAKNLPKTEDLATLQKCVEMLVPESAKNPEFASNYAVIICRLANDNFTRNSVKEVIVSVCEANFHEIFGARLEIARPLSQALGIIGLIAELFKRHFYFIGSANMTLNKLYKSALQEQEQEQEQEQVEKSMEVFIVFLEEAIENLLRIGSLQLEVFWFLVTQKSNRNLSRQLRKRAKQIFARVNEFMETKFGPIRAHVEVQQPKASKSSEDFIITFKKILARLSPTTTENILSEIKNAMDLMGSVLTKPFLQQMAEVMGDQAILHPHLCVSIIEICEELPRRTQQSLRQKIFAFKMTNYIHNQFEKCWVDGKLVASFERMADIQSCIVELVARGHIKKKKLARKIDRLLKSFEADKTATLPILLDLVQKVKSVLPRDTQINQVQSALQVVYDALRAELENSHSDELLEEIRKTLKLFAHSQQDIEEDGESAEADVKSVASCWDDSDEGESELNVVQLESDQEPAGVALEPKSLGNRSTEDISEHRMELCIKDIHDRATADLAHVSEYSKLCENPSSFFDDAAKITCFQKKHCEVR